MDNTIFLKYNKPGPRYTSYPPANFFNTNYTEDDYKKSLILSNQQEPQNISLYIHIPFCPKLCFFCGCNTAHMQKNTLIERYIKAIIKEIKSVSKYINKSRKITQIHWGGGTPNSISISLIAEIMDTIRSEFSIAINHEIAMECNPAYLEFEHIKQFSEIGFNRLSLGIQDFDNNILKNLNREPSKYPINDLAKYIKQIGFQGLNIDLIYGLPGQTIESFKRNIEKAIEISPERLVTFSYAHIPWIKPMQKKLEKIGLPTTEEKINMFFNAYNMLTKNGYTAIGMDHYAKPNDSLTIALKQKKLHRNFQGYCTKETTGQVYGF
jgi:oxygen-independent coproporphyrinogen-3 oxidase